MSSDTDDLVTFLSDKRPEVRKMAVDIVSGLTGTPEGINKLKAVQIKLLGALLRLVPDAATDVSKAALTALVNLSQDTAVSKSLLQFNVVGRVMEYIREKACPHIELLLMLLVNMTSADQGCEDLLQLGKPGMEGLHMALLLKMFVTSAVTLMPGQPDPYEHIGALLTNVLRLAAGRQLLLQPGRGFLQALAAQLGPGSSTMRRRGCSGALRNCCISAEADGTLDQLVADELVLGRMLAPLGGGSPTSTSSITSKAAENGTAAADDEDDDEDGSEPDSGSPTAAAMAALAANGPAAAGSSSSSRDPDDSVRGALAEAVAVLAAVDVGRKALWKVSAPELLKKAYEDEAHPDVCKAMEHAARCFMFDCDASGIQVEEEQQERLRMQQEATD